jgi:hypothetical protein
MKSEVEEGGRVQEESRARIRSFAAGINHQRGGGVKSETWVFMHS